MDLYAQNRDLIPPIITTDRLTLRPFVASDRHVIIEALNDWEITRWLTSVPFPYGDADADYFLNEMILLPGARNWAIATGEGMIGMVGVKPDLGYWMAPAFHGRGLMSEAVAAVLGDYFETGTDPLESGHFVGNGPSRAVLRKHGFVDTQVETVIRRADNARVSLQKMRLDKADWINCHA